MCVCMCVSVEQQVDGITVLCWKHKIFAEVARSWYCVTDTDCSDIHLILADYFHGTWANGKYELNLRKMCWNFLSCCNVVSWIGVGHSHHKFSPASTVSCVTITQCISDDHSKINSILCSIGYGNDETPFSFQVF